MMFGWKIGKHVKSSSIVYCRGEQPLGVGAGQMARVDSSRIAVWKAGEAGLSLKGSVVASEALFPFADGLIAAAEAGANEGGIAGRLGALFEGQAQGRDHPGALTVGGQPQLSDGLGQGVAHGRVRGDGTGTGEPGFGGGQILSQNLTGAYAADLLGGDQPIRLKHPQVFHKRRQPHGEGRRQRLYRRRALGEAAQNGAAGGVGEGVESRIER